MDVILSSKNSSKKRLAIFSSVLNHHQAGVADELYKMLGDDFIFVELECKNENKGSLEDFSSRPYLIRTWEGLESLRFAKKIALSAEVCVFSGTCCLIYMRERLKLNLLTFDMDERPLKRGLINIFSKANLKTITYYWINGWYNKPLYKLCCSAYTSSDYRRMRMFDNKCYKWGYFPSKINQEIINTPNSVINQSIKFIWCARFIKWKHPELPLYLMTLLRRKGYNVKLDMYGGGPLLSKAQMLSSSLGLNSDVDFKGDIPNHELMSEFAKHDVFLFTSDENEGWGVVANEAMSQSCVLVASDKIGSIPYLIKDGINGYIFKSSKSHYGFKKCDVTVDPNALSSLFRVVESLMNSWDSTVKVKREAQYTIENIWNPRRASLSLLQLIDELLEAKDTVISNGPCSKA